MPELLGYFIYSNNCDKCSKLRFVMENQKLLQFFILKCFEEISDNEIINLGLNSVPALIINPPSSSGQKRGIYEGKDAFKWVENIIIFRRQNLMKQAENSRKLIQTNDMKKRLQDGIYEYQPNECEGISDLYSYWKDDMNKDIEDPQPKSFVPVQNFDTYASIMTIPENDTNHKLNKADQEQLIRNSLSSREQQDVQIKNIMEQQQLNRVVEFETKNY